MSELIEYKVRPVERYVVTRFSSGTLYDGAGGFSGSQCLGEFGNAETAYSVAYALCKEEHQKLEWPVGDERIQYPKERTRDEVNAAAMAEYERYTREANAQKEAMQRMLEQVKARGQRNDAL